MGSSPPLSTHCPAMAPKRPASNAGSPPPANGDKAAAPPKAKKPRAPRPRKPKKSAAAAAAANAAAGGSAAGSPPPGIATGSAAASPMPPGASSPPVSPSAGGTGRGGSVLLRDGSVAPKGKERADTAQPDGSGGMDGAGPAEQEEQDAEDEVFEFSDDEVSARLSSCRGLEPALTRCGSVRRQPSRGGAPEGRPPGPPRAF